MISPLLMLLLPLTDLRTAAFQRATLRSIRLYPISSGGNPASRKILVGDSPRKIPYDTHLFESVGVRDAVFRYVGHRRQIPQHLELVHAE